MIENLYDLKLEYNSDDSSDNSSDDSSDNSSDESECSTETILSYNIDNGYVTNYSEIIKKSRIEELERKIKELLKKNGIYNKYTIIENNYIIEIIKQEIHQKVKLDDIIIYKEVDIINEYIKYCKKMIDNDYKIENL